MKSLSMKPCTHTTVCQSTAVHSWLSFPLGSSLMNHNVSHSNRILLLVSHVICHTDLVGIECDKLFVCYKMWAHHFILSECILVDYSQGYWAYISVSVFHILLHKTSQFWIHLNLIKLAYYLKHIFQKNPLGVTNAFDTCIELLSWDALKKSV